MEVVHSLQLRRTRNDLLWSVTGRSIVAVGGQFGKNILSERKHHDLALPYSLLLEQYEAFGIRSNLYGMI